MLLIRSNQASEVLELAILEHSAGHESKVRVPECQPKGLAESLRRTFRHILSQLMRASTDLCLRDILYCSDEDRKLISDFTKTTDALEESTDCLHDLILANCRRYPERLAIRSYDGDGDLTYGELDDLSLRLATHLVSLGVKSEEFVLSSFQKSSWATVARLAILRAGAAYICMHSSNPPAYLRSIIEQSKARLSLSDPSFAHDYGKMIGTTVEVTPEWLRSLPRPNQSTQDVLPFVRPESACTLLFTSGSTGRPKAIIQEHRSWAAALRDYCRTLGLDSSTKFLHFDDYAFSISDLEYLAPLVVGGCGCVPSPMKTVDCLSENIRTLEANATFLTPTVAVQLNPEDVPDLKLLCVGGEPLPGDLLAKWTGASTKLINQYGMGEVALCSALNTDVYHPDNNGAIIGRPATGTIWIVHPTDTRKVMPVGALGEVVIEGPHLARGYLTAQHNSADNTKPAGFLDDTPEWMSQIHPERANARLYRTGDLGRYTNQGQIEYIGRKDTIVKLDGCRVDVIEVEHVARRVLQPRDAIIVDLMGVIDGYEDPRLVAFIFLHDHHKSSKGREGKDMTLSDAANDPVASKQVNRIRRALAETLPAYMIPSLFLLASRLPQTASNKTDRRMIRLLGQAHYMEDRERRRSSQGQPNGSCAARPLPP